MNRSEWLQRLGRFLEDWPDRGLTLVVGSGPGEARVAFAAGLGAPEHREQFAVMARYLFQRDGVCRYGVAAPMVKDGRELTAVEWSDGTQVSQWLLDASGPRQADLGGALLGRLLEGHHNLPGRLRRDLDQLYLRIQVDLADAWP